jgi:hypothetical protein
MKALTVMQPFATLVAIGAKTLETRSWATKYRGRLAIHSSASMSPVFKKLCEKEPFKSILRKAGYKHWSDLPMGAVVCTVSVVGCKTIIWNDETKHKATLEDGTAIEGNEYYFGDYTSGRKAWKLQDVAKFRDPIPAKGQLNLWDWHDPRTTRLGKKPSESEER